MANYTMRADGTAANKAAAVDGDPAVIAECMDITVHNGETFAAGDVIMLADTGGIYRDKLIIPSSGSSGSPILYQAYSGDTPVIKGSDILNDGATYQWTASGSGTNEYYCEAYGGGDPSLTEGDLLFLDGALLAEGETIGLLADHEWIWGNNDTLGYNTFYFADATGDPDSLGVDVEGTQRGCVLVSNRNYVTIDGLQFWHGNGVGYDGGVRSDNCTYLIIQNCEAHYNNGQGISIKGDYCTIDSCTATYNGSHNLSAGGTVGNPALYPTIKNCISHHARTVLYFAEAPWDGYGLKFLFVQYGQMYNNSSYSNDLQGINLDGSHDDTEGTYDCEIYENRVYDNQQQGILVEIFSERNRLYRNEVFDNGQDDGSQSYEFSITHRCPNNEIFGNLIYRTGTQTTSGLLYISEYEAGGGCTGTLIYGNVIDGNDYSTKGIYIDGYTTPEDTIIKNNIITGIDGSCILVTGTSFTGLTHDYNCYRRKSGGSTVVTVDWVGKTIATSCSDWSMDCNSVDDDPLFYDHSNQKFWLKTGSPCINVGVGL